MKTSIKKTNLLFMLLLLSFGNNAFSQLTANACGGGLITEVRVGPQFSIPRAAPPYTNSNGKFYGPGLVTINRIGITDPSIIAAVKYVEDIVDQMLATSSNIVPVILTVQFVPLSSGRLGQARTPLTTSNSFTSTDPAFMSNTLYTEALGNKLAKINTWSYQEADIDISNTENFYYGTDKSPPSAQYDFVTVLLHEVCHALGFVAYPTGSTNSYGAVSNSILYVSIIDRFISNSSVSNTGVMLTSIETPSTNVANYFNSNTYFNGSNARAGNAGVNPPMKSNDRSHMKDGLMKDGLPNGIAIYDLGPVGKGILKDIGWDIAILTGFGDKFYIYKCSNAYPVNDPRCINYKTTVNPGSTNTYRWYFEDNAPYGSAIYLANWKIELFKSDGTMHTLYNANTTSQSINIPVPALPVIAGNTWKRNEDGTVKARLTASGTTTPNSVNFNYSNSVIIGVNSKPDKPVLKLKSINCAANPLSATLTFYAFGATSYTLYYGTSTGNYTNTITIPAGTNTYTLSGLTLGANYYARIKGVNSTGISDTSNEVKIITNYCISRLAAPITEEIKIPKKDTKIISFVNNKILHINNIDGIQKYILTVVNTLGQVIKTVETEVTKENIEFDVSTFENGLYIVNLSTEKEIIYTNKIVINNK